MNRKQKLLKNEKKKKCKWTMMYVVFDFVYFVNENEI